MARGCAGEVLSSEINPLVCRPCAVKGKTIRGAAVCELCTDTTESETLCMASPAFGMRRSSMRGNRESSGSDWEVPFPVRSGKIRDRTPGVYAPEQSDRPIVPEKRSNEGTGTRCVDGPEETAEGRGLTKGNSERSCTYRTLGRRSDMEDPKRARSGKPRTQPRQASYVAPKYVTRDWNGYERQKTPVRHIPEVGAGWLRRPKA